MRLIDADALIQDLKEHNIPFNADINEAIIVAPTIDAVRVVRCKECAHFHSFRPHDGFCQIDGMLWDNDFFCKNGQRREDGDRDG